MGQPLPDAGTDDAGAFAFHDLKPGQYQLGVERRDYPAWKTITVSPSENPDPVQIELIPGAIVSGRILDEDGDPLNGCGVQARRAEHPEQIVSLQSAARDRASTVCSGSARKIHTGGAVPGPGLSTPAFFGWARSAAIPGVSAAVLSGRAGRRIRRAD